jgi:hypothetical protein
MIAIVLEHDFDHLIISNLFQAVGRPDSYFKGVMSKFLMTLDAMYLYPDMEWIFFTDDDVHINAGK